MKESWRHLAIVMFLAGVLLVGMIGTSASMTFIWPAYGVLGLAGVFSIGVILRKSTFSLSPWIGGVSFAALAFFLVRAAHSPVSYLARADAALVVASLLVYGLFLGLLTSAASRHRFVEILAVLTLLNLGFALSQAVDDPTRWIVPGYERTFADRVGGLFNHPDHFAGFLALLTPLWISVAGFGRRRPSIRLASAALGVVSALGVLGTGGSAAKLALAAGLGVLAGLALLLVHRKLTSGAKRAGWRTLGISAAVLALASLAASGPIARHLDRELLTKSGGLSLPLVWQSGWSQFTEAPLLGTGSRTSEIYGRLHRPEALASNAEPEFVHNEYLQALADYGAIGLLLLLSVLAVHAAAGLRFVRAYADFASVTRKILPRSDHLALVLGAMGALASLAVLGAFDFVLHLPVFVMAAAGFNAILAAPDPMAAALKPAPASRLLPVGGLHFAKRALVFGSGLAMALLGVVFSRSEYHYEMARLAFEVEPTGYVHHRHLQAGRALDPKSPWLFSLSGHAHVAGILPEMPGPARRQALEQAEAYFEQARRLHPHDIFTAIGHAAVLDELGRPADALDRLREAREMAPYYGNLMLAEAEHHFRNGRIAEAERGFGEAVNARAYRDTAAAQRGLRTVAEWKLIAEANGFDWRGVPDPVESEPLLAGPAGYRRPSEARVAGRELAGQAPKKEEPADESGGKPADAEGGTSVDGAGD